VRGIDRLNALRRLLQAVWPETKPGNHCMLVSQTIESIGECNRKAVTQSTEVTDATTL
jgi:hypothetical protein